MAKHSGKSSLRKERCMWLTMSGYSSSLQSIQGGRNVQPLVVLRPESGAESIN